MIKKKAALAVIWGAGTVAVCSALGDVDQTYGTLCDRSLRAIEGMSSGDRPAKPDTFKHPELLCSAALSCGGFGNQQKAVEAGQHLDNNAFVLAEKSSANHPPPVRILIAVGIKDKNRASNLACMNSIEGLGISPVSLELRRCLGVTEVVGLNARPSFSDSSITIDRQNTRNPRPVVTSQRGQVSADLS